MAIRMFCDICKEEITKEHYRVVIEDQRSIDLKKPRPNDIKLKHICKYCFDDIKEFIDLKTKVE